MRKIVQYIEQNKTTYYVFAMLYFTSFGLHHFQGGMRNIMVNDLNRGLKWLYTALDTTLPTPLLWRCGVTV